MFESFTSVFSGAAGALGNWMVSPWLFLGGAALILSPIIIHLLNKRQFKRIEWAAMDFLLEADKRNRRRVRLENLLLLLLRCLAVLLIALLVARPFLSSGWAGKLFDSVAYERIVVLDDTLSMAVRQGGQTEFESGKDTLAGFVNSLVSNDSNDSLTLLLASDPQQPLFNDAPINEETSGEMVRTIQELETSDLPGRLDAALLEVQKMLKSRTGSVNRVLYVLSDMRQKDWTFTDDGGDENASGGIAHTLREISQETAGCFIVDAATGETANVGIVGIEPQDKQLVAGVPSRFELTVRNFGSTTAGPVPVKFVVGDSLPVTAQIESIPAGEEASIPFTYTFAPADGLVTDAAEEMIPIRAELDTGLAVEQNRLAADDAGFFAAKVVPGVRTLIVDGDPSATYGQAESFFLARALSPPGDLRSGMNVHVASDLEFEELDLAAYEVIYLCNLYHVTESRLQALEEWVAQGGGLVVAAGNQIDEALYNEQLYRNGEGLLPVEFGTIRGDEREEQWVHFDIQQVRHPVLRVFEGDTNPFLQGVKVFQWWETKLPENTTASERITVSARWTDGERSPAVVEHAFGEGRVLLITTSLDDDWNNWPEDFSYLVAIQELNRYMAPEMSVAGRVAVGQPIRQHIDLTEYKSEFAVTGPESQREVSQATPPGNGSGSDETTWEMNFDGTSRRGFYEVELIRNEGGAERRLYAVNIDPGEGDLRRVEPAALKRRLGDAKVELVGSADLSSLTAEGAKGELWMYILAALVCILCLEQFLAWRFGLRR